MRGNTSSLPPGISSSSLPRKVAGVIEPASIAVSHGSADQTPRCLHGSIIWLKATDLLICVIGYSPDESAIDDASLYPPPLYASVSPSLSSRQKYFWRAGTIPRLVGGTPWKMSAAGRASVQPPPLRCHHLWLQHAGSGRRGGCY